jgi:hypothetical protein
MGLLKQSTARNRMFLMVDSTDHLTGKAAASPVVTLSKDGGAFAAAGGAITDRGSGWYSIALTTTDTNTVGDLAFHVTGTGADPTDWADEVSARLTDDVSTYAGADTSGTTTLLARLTAGRATNLDNLDAAISSRMATFTLPANFSALSISAGGLVDILQTAADKVWSTTTRALTDKAGFALSAAGIQAIWDALTSALTTAGSIGKRIVDNLDTTVGSRSTYAGADTAGTTTLLGRLTAGRATNLDNLDATVSSRSTYAGADTPGTTTLLSRVVAVVPTAAQVSSQVASDAATTPLPANVKKINDVTVNGVGSSGNPWGP